MLTRRGERHVVAGNEHASAVGRKRPAEEPQHGRLPRSVRSDQCTDLARRDVERDAVDGCERAEALREALRDKDRLIDATSTHTGRGGSGGTLGALTGTK